MLNTKSFLTVDFGAGSLKLAEFEVNEAGGLRLKTFAIKPLGAEGSVETTREAVILKALQEALVEKGIKVKGVNVCAPGYHVFSKFVKLPPVDANKVTQIIQYEAQQNVPFPLAEVVWDYQIMGSAASGELEVLLVAVKSEVVEGLFRVAAQAKLQLQLCDASPAALINAFRYNYGDLEDCTMLLDIGAKTSNLIFFEKGKVFSRSINLGANAITHDFANEMKLKFEVAEQVKIAEGFVSLGGAYEEPESPNQAAISKIARQFMTKLHIQVNQTMQFYRGQQGGTMPQKLYLAGGASIMPYANQFFAEKLGVQPEYFNPFRNVQIDPAVNLEGLSHVAHSFGEVVGVALRNLANCPVEMNLMPDTTLRWRKFSEKKPYFLATVFSLALVAFAIGFLFQKLAVTKQTEADHLNPQLQKALVDAQRMSKAYTALLAASNEVSQITAWMDDRYYWIDTLAGTRQLLMTSEEDVRKKLAENRPDVQAGIWIDQMTTVTPDTSGNPLDAAAGAAAASTPQPVSTVTLVLRAVNLSAFTGDPAANNEIAYAVESEFKKDTALFDPKTTGLTGNIDVNDDGTFTFGMTVTLAKPLKL